MMRSNAPIPALLALAAVSFLPAKLLAKPTRHLAHKAAATQPAAKKQTSRETSVESTHLEGGAHNSRHASNSSKSATVSHIHKQHHLARTTNAEVSNPAPAEQTAADAAPKKATSADFIKAAAGQTDAATQDKPAIATPRTTERDKATRPPSPSAKASSVAKPVPVVSVIPPTTERPQLASVADEAATPVILPSLYNKRGRLIVPAPLKGSHEILLRQNQVADREGLDRVQSDDDLADMRSKKMLVALPTSNALEVDDRLPLNRRYCRPWTAQFLATLARAHYARFHTPLQVNSAIRTVEFQQRLLRTNGNAAPAEGDTASPHLTGQAIDIAKHGLSLTEIAWMRGYLLPLVHEGKVDVEEEFQQACFHISVYKKYLPPGPTPKRDLASSHGDETAALATGLR